MEQNLDRRLIFEREIKNKNNKNRSTNTGHLDYYSTSKKFEKDLTLQDLLTA